MSDPEYLAVPPGGYSLDEDERREQLAYERGEYQSMADLVVDAAIEETLLARARRKLDRLHQETN